MEQGEDEILSIREGLTACRAIGVEVAHPMRLTLLIEAQGKVGQNEKGLSVVAEALAQIDKTGERIYEAELWRLRGELTLAQSSVQRLESRVNEAEECFLKAIGVARTQHAKSLELRAVMSLVRLRKHQAENYATRTTQHATRTKLDEAHSMLSQIYNWFTEGFDTKDLQEANALLDTLATYSSTLQERPSP